MLPTLRQLQYLKLLAEHASAAIDNAPTSPIRVTPIRSKTDVAI